MSEDKPAAIHRRIWFGDACDEWALSPGDGCEEYMSLREAQERERLLTEALEYYEALQWRPRVIQWWPFTRTDVISRRATKTLAKIRGTNG